MFCGEEFEGLAKAMAQAQGYQDFPLVIVPKRFESYPQEQVGSIAESKLDEIVQLVT